MATRRYGPTQGAGTVLVEKEAQKSIRDSQYGVTVHVGAYERGSLTELNYCPNKKTFEKKMGGRISGYLAPDAALDFFDLAEGSGEMYCVRVTDGTEASSEVTLYNRRVPRSAVITVAAKSAGRWAGKRKHYAQAVSGSGDILETTLTTGVTMLLNEWAGATLTLDEVTSQSYTVLSNTTAGVITVASDETMKTDWTAGGGSALGYVLAMVNGTKKLSVYVTDGVEAPGTEWGIMCYLDGVLAYRQDNLSSDPANKRYFVTTINDDTSNDSIQVTDLWTGSITASIRPANHYDSLSNITDTVATVEIMTTTVNGASGGNATAGKFVYGQLLKPQKYTLTFSSATAYTVASDVYGALGAGTVGTQFTTTIGPTFHISFNIAAGGTAMAASDTIVIQCSPLVPDELIGGRIYPDYEGARRTYYIITDNTVDTITTKAADTMTATGTAGVAATRSSSPETYDTSSLDQFDLSVDGGPLVNVTLTASATQTALIIAADINALIPGIANGATGSVVLTSLTKGRNSSVAVFAGNANAGLGFTDNTTIFGTAGDSALVMFKQELAGGYDGLAAIADADYTTALDTDDSLINGLFGKNKGLVKVACPGVTTTAVQKAGAGYAESRNYQWRYECPSNITTEDAAETWLNDTVGRNDFAVGAFPAFAYVNNPEPNSSGLKLVSLTGMIQGREAKMARTWEGYFKAAAGTDVTLPTVVKLTTADKVLNEEYLNPQGFQIIKFKNANAIVWGDRSMSLDPAWKWKHQRESMSHYGNVFRENFDWLMFMINDEETWDLAYVALDEYLEAEHKKRALRGKTKDEAYSIKIDSENNTTASMADGDMNAEVRMRLADTVERGIFTLSKLGIFEDIGASA